MKHYLINAIADWADEFDVPIYEILNEEERNTIYKDILNFLNK